MDEFKKPYTTLFNAVTDALRALERGDAAAAVELLRKGQQNAEEQYISAE